MMKLKVGMISLGCNKNRIDGEMMLAKLKEAGKVRQEGKEYLVKDGDVIFFKFNV